VLNEPDEMTHPRVAGPVMLTVTHSGVAIPAAVAARVEPVLRVPVTEFGCCGPRGHRRRHSAEVFYQPAPGGGLRAAPGLAERAVEHLLRLGVDARLDDRRRYGDRLRPDLGVLGRCRPALLPLLTAAAVRPRGVDVVAGRDELADRVAALCRLFPAAPAMIFDTNAELAEDLRRRLLPLLDGHVFRGSEDFWSAAVRRVVAPLPKLDVTNPDDFGLLIAADARAVCTRGHWPALHRLWPLKAYGFQSAGQVPSDREQLRVEAVFGRPLVPATTQPRVAVHVVVPPRTLPPADGVGLLERKREAIWKNPPRNEFVAAVATAIATNDGPALASFGLARPGCDLRGRGGERPAVAVLVESPEHARHLTEHLSGWRAVRYEPGPSRVGWGGWNSEAPLRDPAGFDRCVLTTMAARRVESLDVDVLVRADGAGSPLRLPGFPAPARQADRPQVLIDLADDFDPAAEADTRARLRAHRTAGWSIGAAPQWVMTD
jgi:hypothetical protein